MSDDSGPIVTIHFAWWFRPYVSMLITFCVLMQREPDWEKLQRVIQRSMRVRVEPR